MTWQCRAVAGREEATEVVPEMKTTAPENKERMRP